MKMHLIAAFPVTIGLALTLASNAARATLAPQFVNGGFEQPQTFFKILYTGESIPGWRVAGGAIDLCGTAIWQAAGGNMSVDMVDTPSRGALAQDLTFGSASDYYVGFQLSRNWNINYQVVKLGVWYKPPSATDFVGLGYFEYGAQNSAQNMMWESTGTHTFTSEPGVTTFLFAALSGNSGEGGTASWGGAAIDDVQLVAGQSPFSAALPSAYDPIPAAYGHYDVYDNVPPGGEGAVVPDVPPGGGGAVVPEPSTWLAGIGATFAMLGTFVRRTRK
jgi:hypothetical protein